MTGDDRPAQRVNLNDVIDRVFDRIRRLHPDVPAELTRDDLPGMRGWPDLLEQLFENLVGNAIKYRHSDRGLTVHVGCGEDCDDEQPSDSAEVRVTVTDNGRGVEAPYRERIFLPFHRGHFDRPGLGQSIPGTGVGLALARRVVEIHGGSIRMEEAEGGEGSVFHVVLDCDATDAG